MTYVSNCADSGQNKYELINKEMADSIFEENPRIFIKDTNQVEEFYVKILKPS
jgi:hypothetical protein